MLKFIFEKSSTQFHWFSHYDSGISGIKNLLKKSSLLDLTLQGFRALPVDLQLQSQAS